MDIKGFTKPELDYLRENCNFIGNELELFNLRGRGISVEQAAEMIGLTDSGARKVSVKINDKIKRVLSRTI